MQILSDDEIIFIPPRFNNVWQNLANICAAEFTQAGGVIITGIFDM